MVVTLNPFGVQYLLGGPPCFDSLHKGVYIISSRKAVFFRRSGLLLIRHKEPENA
jgi:hypothetical protein